MEEKMRIEYDDAANFRIVNEETGKKSKWVSYTAVAVLKDEGKMYLGLSEYWGEGEKLYDVKEIQCEVKIVSGRIPI
jgi:hypothetical protein